MRRTLSLYLAILCASASAAAGCAGRAAPASLPPGNADRNAGTSERASGGLAQLSRRQIDAHIQHVVIVMQENRSLNNLFNGYPGATTTTTAPLSTGAQITLQPVPLEAKTAGAEHFLADFLAACNGTGSFPGTNCRMNGFDLEKGQKNAAFDYVPQSETVPLWAIANEFVLDDNMFQSQVDSSFTAHQYIIASQTNNAVNIPTSTWGCGNPSLVPTITAQRTLGPMESPCFDPYNTLADEIDATPGMSWRFYSGSSPKGGGDAYSSYRAVKHIRYGRDWHRNISAPATNFLVDVPAGKLATVTWITPSWDNSDHPGSHKNSGPSWVASIVNAIGQSKFWNSTMIFVTWDDWGGFYDPVAPTMIDYDGPGFRVPLLCITPYAYRGKVRKGGAMHDFDSIVRFVEWRWKLPSMTQRDAKADPADDGCTNTHQTTPRPFVPIPSNFSRDFFLHQSPYGPPPDDDGY